MASKVGEDPEYQAFVRKTEFDYKQDLETALVAFAPTGKFMLLKGRFDWKSLSNYVRGSRRQVQQLVLPDVGQHARAADFVFPGAIQPDGAGGQPG